MLPQYVQLPDIPDHHPGCPVQMLLKFKDRTELSDYLMLKYDNSWGQDTAHTLIMENSDLMDGWRILENQENAS